MARTPLLQRLINASALHGAVESGERTAREVAADLGLRVSA